MLKSYLCQKRHIFTRFADSPLRIVHLRDKGVLTTCFVNYTLCVIGSPNFFDLSKTIDNLSKR